MDISVREALPLLIAHVHFRGMWLRPSHVTLRQLEPERPRNTIELLRIWGSYMRYMRKRNFRLIFAVIVNYIEFTVNLQHLLPSANKVVESNVFRSMCQEFCPRGVSDSVHAGMHNPPPPQTPPAQHPPGRHPQQTATASDGTHPC